MKNKTKYMAACLLTIPAYIILVVASLFALSVFFIQHVIMIIVSPSRTARLFKYYSLAQDTVWDTHRAVEKIAKQMAENDMLAREMEKAERKAKRKAK